MKRIFLSSIEDQRLETDILMDKRLAAMQVRPNDFVVRCLPQKEYSDNGYMFNQLLDHINGKVVLDIGCGDGMYSVYVLHRKARQVHAIDISKKALLVTRMLAKLNKVEDNLFLGLMDGGRLAYKDNVFDIVFGRAVLHHFDNNYIHEVMKEIYRVLKVGGEAVFSEPVEDSRFFEWIQQLIPSGRPGTAYYRPSRLSCTSYLKYTKNEIDAVLTTKILLNIGKDFDDVHIKKFGFFIRFDRFTFGRPYGLLARIILDKIDGVIFRIMPFLRRYCRIAVIRYRKQRK